MSATPFAVKCGKCKLYHINVDAVRRCHFPPRAVAAVAQSGLVDRATVAQLDYLRKLGCDMAKAIHYTKAWASREIDRLKKEAAMSATPMESAPNRTTTIVPLSMLQAVPDGYYATRQDSSESYTFFRISRPKPTTRSRFAGCLKVQTQHGPDYKLALVVWPDGKITVYNKSMENDLLLVVVDMRGSAMTYAEEIGTCMRCNCELTDERSRWFGIGPECEKHWDWVIPTVEDNRGPFRHGWEA